MIDKAIYLIQSKLCVVKKDNRLRSKLFNCISQKTYIMWNKFDDFIANTPAQDQNSNNELQNYSSDDWAPFDLRIGLNMSTV